MEPDTTMGRHPILGRPIFFSNIRLLSSVVGITVMAACGGPTQPTVVKPPTDPPAITCPAVAPMESATGSAIPVTYTDPIVAGGLAPFTLACTPVSGANFPIGSTNVTCTVTDAQRRSANCAFAVTVTTAPTPVLSVTTFVAFGDSITYGEDGRNTSAFGSLRSYPRVQLPLFQVYPTVLQGLLAARYRTQRPTVANEGNPGESAQDAGTLPRFSRVLSGGRYGGVLIMEGSNDLFDRDARLEPAAIAALGQMILDAKSRGVRPFLATIPPMNPAGTRGLAWSLVPGFNDRVRTLAHEQGVPLVEVYNALNVSIGTFIGPDGLHPTAEGYAKIADTFFGVIKQILEVPRTVAPTVTAQRSRVIPLQHRPALLHPRVPSRVPVSPAPVVAVAAWSAARPGRRADGDADLVSVARYQSDVRSVRTRALTSEQEQKRGNQPGDRQRDQAHESMQPGELTQVPRGMRHRAAAE